MGTYLLNGFKVLRAVLAQGADKVLRQGFALIDVAADRADVALLALGLGFGLDVCVVVGVGHGLAVRDGTGFGDGADEHTVALQIHVLLHLQGQDGVDIAREDDQAVIEDQTMYYFENNEFAGTDEYGRKYSVVWLPMATYDADSDTWNYFGKNSSEERYIGWYYTVEWYDANSVIIATDQIRVNLSNESCHYNVKDFYMGGYLQGVLAGETELQKSNGKVTIPMATADALGLVKASDEITVDADAKLVAVAIPISKLQDDGTVLTIDGGNAID